MKNLLYLVPIEFRLGGKNFSKTYKFLKESDKWDSEALLTYQAKNLTSILKYCKKHVPFYSNMSLKLDQSRSDLYQFPIINKELLQNNLSQFMSPIIQKKDTYQVSTGGTSGKSLSFNLDNSTYGNEWAFVMTGWRRVGYMPGDKLISFRGVNFNRANKGIYWQKNPIYNTIEMSPFHLSEDNLPKYVEAIKKIKPKYIHGYPSAITILAKYVEQNVKNFPKIDAVLGVSENIYSGQRELIEHAFKTRFFSFYGQSEKVIMAHECEWDRRYHAFPEYGITELLDKNGEPVGEGERGELVGTGFLNYCIPFIRYSTGDYAVLSDQKCKCGRKHLILEDLVGRWAQEVIIGKDGAPISLTALNFHSDIFNNIYSYQFVQKKEGELVLKIIPKSAITDTEYNEIKSAFFLKVGSNIDLSIQIVNKISLTTRGKHKLLVHDLT